MTIEELKLLITGDSREGQKAVQEFGDKLKEAIEHPVSSVKNLAGELGGHLTEALGTAGVAVAVAAAALAALAVGVLDLGEKAAAVGSAINNLSEKVGDSTENISKLSYATTIAGGSVESLTNIAYMMSVRLGDVGASGEKARSAIQKLGLDVDEFIDAAPSERILLLSDALRSTSVSGDEVRRALMDLGGRQVRDQVAVLSKDLRGLAEQGEAAGAVWSEVDAKAAEDFEMKVRALHEQWALFTTNIGRLFIPALLDLAEKLNRIFVPGSAPNTTGQFLDPKAQLLAEAYAKALEKDRDTAWDTAAGLDGLSISIHANAEEVDAAVKKHEALAEAVTKVGDAANDDRNIFGGLTTINEGLETSFQDLSFKVKNYGDDVGTATEEARDYLHNHRAEIQDAVDAMNALDSTTLSFGDLTIPNLSSHLTDNTNVFERWLGGIEGGLARLPTLIERGLTGGGGLGGALKAFGSDIGGSLFTAGGPLNSLGNSLTKGAFKISEGSGQLLGTALPGIGSVIGSMIGPLMSKLFAIGGPSKQELEGRDVEATFQKQFGSFQQMMDAVGAAYAATGRSAQQAQADVKALMDAEKQGGAAAKAMADQIQSAFTEQADQIQSAFTEQKRDAADLETAIRKYNFSINELGPAMQKQKLDDQAKQLLNDWRLLVQSGIELVTVDQHMASSMNDYLKVARQTGQEVPSAMKPILQTLVEQGLLTDDNGDKITDLAAIGVTFSQTLTEALTTGFGQVVNKLDELLRKIGLIPATAADAARAIPSNPFAEWRVPEDLGNIPIPMAAGGIGRVTRPTLFLAGEAGPEDVAFSGGGKRFGGAGGVTVNVDASGAMFRDRASLRELASLVGDAVTANLRLNRQLGLRTT